MKKKLLIFWFLFAALSPTSFNILAKETLTNYSLSDAASNEHSSLILNRSGPGKNNVIQGIALDSKNDLLYTLHVTGKPEQGVINRFDYKKQNNSTGIQLPSSSIGHQGFSISPKDGSFYSSAGKDMQNRGWYISKFVFSVNSPPKNLEEIQIFDQKYSRTTNSMPTISPDYKYIIIRGRKEGTDVIRIYNLHDFELHKSDLSSLKNVEWGINNEFTQDDFAFQAITASNKYIYILSGGENLKPKRLFVYDFSGNLIRKFPSVTLGWNKASSSGIEKHWEPEGLSFDIKSQELLIAFAIGDKKNRKALVYFIPVTD